MALTVTPGGVSDDALVSLADFQAYCSARGYSLLGVVDATQEQSIRLATVWVEGMGHREKGGTRWPGKRTSDTQRRLFPRTGATYRDGTAIAADIIPACVADAVCEAAAFDLTNPGALTGSLNLSEVVTSAGAGPAKVTFRDAKTEREARTMIQSVSDLLADLLLPETYRPFAIFTV